MLHLIIAIAGILFTILFVIGTHEAAHFLAARLAGVKVLRFSIGFGKTLFRWRDKRETEYVFALVPLGGYVKMLDENEGNVPKDQLHLAFNRQPYYKKFFIVLAGPVANLFCAFVLYWLIFVIGFVSIKPIIGTVAPHSIAADAGIKPKQEIIRIDDQKTLTWTTILFRLVMHAGNQDHLKLEVKNLPSQKLETYRLNLSTWHMDGLSPDPLGSLGITPYQPNVPLVVGNIAPQSPAAASMLKLGDKIIAVDKNPIKNWQELINLILTHPDTAVTFTIIRANKTLTVPINLGHQRRLGWQKQGYLGIGPNFVIPKELLQTVKYTPLSAISRAAEEVTDLTYFNLLLFGKLLTGKVSLQSLGGPITIFETAGTALNYGLLPFLGFLAFLSLSIGVINLLPIPGLDGGHLFIQTIEAIMRKPVPERVLILLYKLGFALIILVFIQALINDVLRLY